MTQQGVCKYFCMGVLLYLAHRAGEKRPFPPLPADAEELVRAGYEWAENGGYDQMPEGRYK